MPIDPTCDTCGQFVRLRHDGTVMNHRGSDGLPCEGARRQPVMAERAHVPSGRVTWKFTGGILT